jgi:methyl-accepting chemotaxis protein
VVITIPAQSAQQMAIGIASPLLIMIVFVAVFTLILMLFVIRLVTASLKSLAVEANRIADGELNQALIVEGNDEVAQLRHAFEQMRIRLKSRLDELNRLLIVSQGVAASLEMEEAVQPILESALVTGGSAARVVLTPDMLPDSSIDDKIRSHPDLGSGLRETYINF